LLTVLLLPLEAASSSGTSVCLRTTQCHTPEDRTLHCSRCERLTAERDTISCELLAVGATNTQSLLASFSGTRDSLPFRCVCVCVCVPCKYNHKLQYPHVKSTRYRNTRLSAITNTGKYSPRGDRSARLSVAHFRSFHVGVN
jgi:hypothetical protein